MRTMLCEAGLLQTCYTSNRFKLAAHPSQTEKFSNILTLFKLKLILRPTCDLCGKSFRKESMLDLHRQNMHGVAGEVIADAETSMCQVGQFDSKPNDCSPDGIFLEVDLGSGCPI